MLSREQRKNTRELYKNKPVGRLETSCPFSTIPASHAKAARQCSIPHEVEGRKIAGEVKEAFRKDFPARKPSGSKTKRLQSVGSLATTSPREQTIPRRPSKVRDVYLGVLVPGSRCKYRSHEFQQGIHGQV
ncbi:hypothetical protein VFPFJ_05841 [Purpureocillium lilacinum]|uniref:Uncharacterized protein n=1 Tax=Purpureocillium lilacinum TaxID=33203 RepID=A0A179HHN5_PURLI|nr:hypothetical protein VFPFJ_05841 [Purpureocillium lilacinum]OAQ89432.1 hypothetical protein VFPFJ_05841 [Purpureocillium lilacinum]